MCNVTGGEMLTTMNDILAAAEAYFRTRQGAAGWQQGSAAPWGSVSAAAGTCFQITGGQFPDTRPSYGDCKLVWFFTCPFIYTNVIKTNFEYMYIDMSKVCLPFETALGYLSHLHNYNTC